MELPEGKQFLNCLLHPPTVQSQKIVLCIFLKLRLHLIDRFKRTNTNTTEIQISSFIRIANRVTHFLYLYKTINIT